MKLKTTLPFLFFVFLFCQNINAQSFVDEGNQWSLVSYNFVGYAYNQTFRIEGDSTINGITYKKLLNAYGHPDTASWNISSLIREDSTKKVFQFVGLNNEILIFDFGLLVGDTIISNDSPDNLGIVSAIDSIELNDGTMRKRLALSSLSCPDWGIIEYWIEGIGGENLAFTFIDLFCAFDVGINLLCFSNNGDFLLGGQNGATCFIINSTNELEQNALRIFPNPTQNILNLEYDEMIKIEQLSILDYQGQAVKSLQTENNISQISISDFPQGVYYLKIETTKSKFIFKKFIKIN